MKPPTFPSEKQIQVIQRECDSLISYLRYRRTHKKLILKRIQAIRQWLDALEGEYTNENR